MRLTDENGTMLMVNEAFCKIVEMPEEALIGQPFDIIYARMISRSLRKIQTTL
jgi:PAS domain S-box-containing protein